MNYRAYFVVILHNPVSGIGARELWGTLRRNSQVKLEKQDDVIPLDVKVRTVGKNSNVEE